MEIDYKLNTNVKLFEDLDDLINSKDSYGNLQYCVGEYKSYMSVAKLEKYNFIYIYKIDTWVKSKETFILNEKEFESSILCIVDKDINYIYPFNNTKINKIEYNHKKYTTITKVEDLSYYNLLQNKIYSKIKNTNVKLNRKDSSNTDQYDFKKQVYREITQNKEITKPKNFEFNFQNIWSSPSVSILNNIYNIRQCIKDISYLDKIIDDIFLDENEKYRIKLEQVCYDEYVKQYIYIKENVPECIKVYLEIVKGLNKVPNAKTLLCTLKNGKEIRVHNGITLNPGKLDYTFLDTKYTTYNIMDIKQIKYKNYIIYSSKNLSV